MDALNLQQHLLDLLAAIPLADFTDEQRIAVPFELLDPDDGIDWVAQAGTVDGGAGLVLRTKDGREFHLTLTRSR